MKGLTDEEADVLERNAPGTPLIEEVSRWEVVESLEARGLIGFTDTGEGVTTARGMLLLRVPPRRPEAFVNPRRRRFQRIRKRARLYLRSLLLEREAIERLERRLASISPAEAERRIRDYYSSPRMRALLRESLYSGRPIFGRLR